MKHYENPDHKGAAGLCCESIFTFGCGRGDCDPFFIICLGPGWVTRKDQIVIHLIAVENIPINYI